MSFTQVLLVSIISTRAGSGGLIKMVFLDVNSIFGIKNTSFIIDFKKNYQISTFGHIEEFNGHRCERWLLNFPKGRQRPMIIKSVRQIVRKWE